MSDTEVIVKNSLIVKGDFKLIHEDGREESISGKRSFCRCGLSAAMPFCDQTHRSKLEWVKKTDEE
jgi:CDGSH-type Zn-finger protein